jgi:hypothetical protein
MMVQGTKGIAGAIQPDGEDAPPGASIAPQHAQAKTTPAMSSRPRTTSVGKTDRIPLCLVNLENWLIEDIKVISP